MKTSKPIKWIAGGIVGFLLLIVIVILVLILLGPPVGGIFSNIVEVTCVYRVNVVAFEDVNGDGIQNPGEAGIAGVNVSFQHSLPMATGMPDQTLTNATGQAVFDYGGYCVTRDAMTINAVPPSGYSATTPLSFGPYPVPEYTSEAKTLAAKQPIPDVIYVGLRKNS